MLSRLADALARVSARFVPDAFSIAALLTLVTFGLGLSLGEATPEACVRAWGGSVWTLLPLSMQIALVIFAGYMLAVAPPTQALLDVVARVPRTPRQAVAFTALASMTLCWLNWGMGLIAIVLGFALLLHPSPASLVKAAEAAAKPLHGVVLQFPL